MAEAQVLQQDLWGRLPYELIELVLGKLPFSELPPFCYSCRKWEKLILSARAHSLFLFTADEFVVWNLSTRLWEHVSLQFLQGEQYKSLCLVASSGGLVCFTHNCAANFKELIVCNPLTRRYRRLPGPRQLMPTLQVRSLDGSYMNGLVCMLADNDTGHFKLVVLGTRLKTTDRLFTGFVYCSRDNLWTTTTSAKIPKAAYRFLGKSNLSFSDTQVVEHLGSVYWTFSTYLTSKPHEYLLVKYNVKLDWWSWSDVGQCQDLSCSHVILPYDGKLLFLHNDGEHPEQLKIPGKESDSSHALGFETPRIPLSPRSIYEKMALKFIPRIDDSPQVLSLYNSFLKYIGDECGGYDNINVHYCGDRGPVTFCIGAVGCVRAQPNSMASRWWNPYDSPWNMPRLNMSRLSKVDPWANPGKIPSDVETWVNVCIHSRRGGVLTPTLKFCN